MRGREREKQGASWKVRARTRWVIAIPSEGKQLWSSERERLEGGQKERRGEEERCVGRTRQREEAKMKELRNEQGWAAEGRGDSSALTVILNYCLMFSVFICSLIFCAAH